MHTVFKKITYTLCVLSVLVPTYTNAQEVQKATVTKVLSEETTLVPETKAFETVQQLEVTLPDQTSAYIENSYAPVKAGDSIFIIQNQEGMWFVREINRTPILLFTLFLFIAISLFVGKTKGLRGLLSLSLSIGVLFFILIPYITEVSYPLLFSFTTVTILMSVGAVITHGWNKGTLAATLGIFTTLVITAVIGYSISTHAHITGQSTDESVFLKTSLGINNIRALFLSGVLISLLGVLYDGAISQAIYIQKQFALGVTDFKKLYRQAMDIGRSHVGALIDTLAIVSIGSSLLELILFIKQSTEPLGFILSQEPIALEILQILVGSMGLMITIPITTAISIWVFKQSQKVR